MHMPEVADSDVFVGEIIHSCQYRDAETFRDKTVFVVGGGHSGIDIALELASVSKKVGFPSLIQKVYYYYSHHLQLLLISSIII